VKSNQRAEHAISCSVFSRRQLFAGLTVILFVAFLLRLYFALRFPNIHHDDELLQYLEQAHRLVFKYGVVPWEYREAARSWLVPGFLAGLLKLSDILGISEPSVYLFFVAACLSALSLSAVLVGFLWSYRTYGGVAGIITGALCAVWFELVYFAPKTLTEPIAADFFLIAVYLAYPTRATASRGRLFAAGILFGLVVAIRLQLAPAVLVAVVYICRNDISGKWTPIILGGLATCLSAGALDALTWQYPFQSFVSNIWINIIEKKSETFGTPPWYYFAGKWVLIWGGAIVPIAFLSVIALRKNILLGLIAFTIIATHMLFAHKEYRFVFPAVPFVIILVGLGTAEVLNHISKDIIKTRKQMIAVVAGIIFCWSLTSGVLAAGDHFRPNWFRESGRIRAFDFLHDRSDLCGVGMFPAWLLPQAGYTHLHRNVPIIIPQTNVAASFPAYNYAVANPQDLPNPFPYAEVKCWANDKICVYRREGFCESRPDLEVNEVFRRRGQ
jgi:GPI mannosyltransferase 3